MVVMNTSTSPAGRARMTHPDGSPVRVLVVDDEPTLAELLSMALRYEGWEVQTAGDGRAAVAGRPRVRARTSSCST